MWSFSLLLLAVLPSVNGHAYMSKPKSRNMVHGIGPKFGGSGDGSLGGAGNIQNLNAVSYIRPLAPPSTPPRPTHSAVCEPRLKVSDSSPRVGCPGRGSVAGMRRSLFLSIAPSPLEGGLTRVGERGVRLSLCEGWGGGDGGVCV